MVRIQPLKGDTPQSKSTKGSASSGIHKKYLKTNKKQEKHLICLNTQARTTAPILLPPARGVRRIDHKKCEMSGARGAAAQRGADFAEGPAAWPDGKGGLAGGGVEGLRVHGALFVCSCDRFGRGGFFSHVFLGKGAKGVEHRCPFWLFR